MGALCTSQNWAQSHKHLTPKISHMDREPQQSLSGFWPLQTFHMCHFINYLFMTMEKGYIHISPHWKGIYSKHFSFRSSRTKFPVNYSKDKTKLHQQSKQKSWTTKNISTCALCTHQFQILPLSSLLKVYRNTRAHPNHMTEDYHCVNRDVHVCYC